MFFPAIYSFSLCGSAAEGALPFVGPSSGAAYIASEELKQTQQPNNKKNNNEQSNNKNTAIDRLWRDLGPRRKLKGSRQSASRKVGVHLKQTSLWTYFRAALVRAYDDRAEALL